MFSSILPTGQLPKLMKNTLCLSQSTFGNIALFVLNLLNGEL